MAAWVSRTPIGLDTALGPARAEQFLSLARLHADGWGIATADPAVGREVGLGPFPSAARMRTLAANRGRAGIAYLRFASRGSSLDHASSQPFIARRIAFGHNGSLPREAAAALLGDAARAGLRSGSDSEVYFALVRERIDSGRPVAVALAEAADRLRAVAPDACLNAVLLTSEALYAVQSSAGRAAPLDRFAERGFAEDSLPLGHGAEYNRMRIAAPADGIHVVATSGFDQRDWRDLPEDTVTTLTADSVETRGIRELLG